MQAHKDSCDASVEEIAKVVSDSQKRVQDKRPGSPKFIVYISNLQPIAALKFIELPAMGKAAPRPNPHHSTTEPTRAHSISTPNLNQAGERASNESLSPRDQKSFGSTHFRSTALRPAISKPLRAANKTNPRCHCRHNAVPRRFPQPTDDTMSSKNPIRLPPLRVLRVRNPNRSEPNPCLTIMSSVLGTSRCPFFA